MNIMCRHHVDELELHQVASAVFDVWIGQHLKSTVLFAVTVLLLSGRHIKSGESTISFASFRVLPRPSASFRVLPRVRRVRRKRSEYQSVASIMISFVAVIFGGPFGRFGARRSKEGPAVSEGLGAKTRTGGCRHNYIWGLDGKLVLFNVINGSWGFQFGSS